MKVVRILLVILGLMVWAPNNLHTYANSNYQIYLNEQLVSFQEPLFVENGRLFVPVRFVGEQLGAAVEWNGAEQSVLIKSPIEDDVRFYFDSKKVLLNGSNYTMDVKPLNRYKRMYLPIRHVSELLHLKVDWNDELRKINLSSVPLYVVQTGDSLTSISESFHTTAELIKERNSLQSNTLDAGTNIKTVIPMVMTNNEDVELLAKIIEAESGSEPFIGQVAIGNVILNRVEDNRFPNSVEAVIKQEGQFTPVKTGIFNIVQPSKSARDAAQNALKGEKPVGEAVYFFNPEKTNNPFLLAREVIIDIGSHRFTK